MDQDSVVVATATATAVAKDAYSDTLHPTAIVAGQALAGPLALLALPFRMMGHASELLLEKGNSWLDEKLKNVKPEDQIAPKPNIAVPTMQNLLYNVDDPDDDGLRDAFLNLLANAMTKNSVSKVHQSFPHILEEMSPTDAIYLKELYLSGTWSYTIGQIKLKDDKKGSKYLFHHLAISSAINDVNTLSVSIDNLARLRLVDITYSAHLTDEGAYDALENHPYFLDMKKNYENQTRNVSLVRGAMTITTLGLQFGSVVLQPPKA